MTIEQFENTGFSINTKVIYKGKIYDVVSVDFEENLIAICTSKEDLELDFGGIEWKRCENCEIV